VIPSTWATDLGILDIKTGSLSLFRALGSTNLGILSLSKHLATSVAFSVWAGKISTHLVKVAMKNKRYLHPSQGGS
jgi:hypothetical protein